MKRFINRATFLQAISIRFLCSLRSCQINKMKVSIFPRLDTMLPVLRLYFHGEDRMRSRAALIVEGWANMSTFRSLLQNFHCIITASNGFFTDSLDIDTLFQIFPDAQIIAVPIKLHNNKWHTRSMTCSL